MHASSESKQRLQEKFIAAFDRLDREDREPDRWEEESLAYALSALANRLLLAADLELEVFSRPPAERSPDTVRALEENPRRFTKNALRRMLELVLQDRLPASALSDAVILEQQIGDKGIGLALPAEGRGLAVPGHELNIFPQRP